MAVDELAAQLRRILSSLPMTVLEHAGNLLDEAHRVLTTVTYGTSSAELQSAAVELSEASQSVKTVDELVGRIAASLTVYLRQLGVEETAVAALPSDPLSNNQAMPMSAEVQASDGSRYPAAASWCVDVLPRRVRENQPGQRTTGFMDCELAALTSGRDGTWTPQVLNRMRELGMSRRLEFLATHVEMKAAAKMVAEGRRHSELVLNHVPCGSQPQQNYTGCHQALDQYLPSGWTLTVRGTTQQGQPFTNTYTGKGAP